MGKYNAISFGNKNKWNTDTYYNLVEPWKHYTKWKKLVTKNHRLYESIYMKCPEQAGLETERRFVFA